MTEAVVDLAEWLRSMHPMLKRGAYAFDSLSAASVFYAIQPIAT